MNMTEQFYVISSVYDKENRREKSYTFCLKLHGINKNNSMMLTSQAGLLLGDMMS